MTPLPTKPSADAPWHVGRPNIGDRGRFMQRVEQMLDRRFFTNGGPLVKEFETALCAYLGVRHCVAVNNATIGLEIAARALNLKGDVIVPAFTFIATAHALRWQHLTPRFADIDPTTKNLDPGSVERLITPRTSGILGVHLWGRPCAIEALTEIAKCHGLKLFYDAAHAFGCTHDGQMIGNFGCCEVFSFHATKFLNSFEGGAITTNDDQLAARLRLMRNFGFSGFDCVSEIGTNGKMPEVCAAMGLTSLEAIDELIETNRYNYREYRAQLSQLPGISMVEYDEAEKNNFQYIVVEVDSAQAGTSRDMMVDALQREHILARRYFWPGCHQMEPYRSGTGQRPSLPVTERKCNQTMVLPNGQAMNSSMIEHVCAIIKRQIKRGD